MDCDAKACRESGCCYMCKEQAFDPHLLEDKGRISDPAADLYTIGHQHCDVSIPGAVATDKKQLGCKKARHKSLTSFVCTFFCGDTLEH